MAKRPIEFDVRDFKLRVLRYAADKNVDSAIVMAALADIVGMSAATLDRHVAPQSFESRLDSFIERARVSYQCASMRGIKSA